MKKLILISAFFFLFSRANEIAIPMVAEQEKIQSVMQTLAIVSVFNKRLTMIAPSAKAVLLQKLAALVQQLLAIEDKKAPTPPLIIKELHAWLLEYKAALVTT